MCLLLLHLCAHILYTLLCVQAHVCVCMCWHMCMHTFFFKFDVSCIVVVNRFCSKWFWTWKCNSLKPIKCTKKCWSAMRWAVVYTQTTLNIFKHFHPHNMHDLYTPGGTQESEASRYHPTWPRGSQGNRKLARATTWHSGTARAADAVGRANPCVQRTEYRFQKGSRRNGRARGDVGEDKQRATSQAKRWGEPKTLP